MGDSVGHAATAVRSALRPPIPAELTPRTSPSPRAAGGVGVTAPTSVLSTPIDVPSSTQSRIVGLVFRAVISPLVRRIPITAWPMSVAFAVDLAAKVIPTPTGVTAEKVHFAGFDAEIVRPCIPRSNLAEGAVLYFHGGAFLIGGLNSHRPVVAALARRTGLPVIHVAYRQLPRTPITGSIDDCTTTYRWLLDQGADPATVVFAGDSAGGFLAFATAVAAAHAGMPRPAGLIGFSPWLDLDCTTKLAHPNRTTDAYLPAELLATVSRIGGYDPVTPNSALSPTTDDLAALPPVLLIAAESEVVRIDSELMAGRLANAGVPCVVHIWHDQIHAFTTLFPDMPESRAALDAAAHFIHGRISATVNCGDLTYPVAPPAAFDSAATRPVIPEQMAP
ncbi:alpha/beta hydrolase [Antrihabitans stalactiti]|uniref:Alpha/beta hydrolase n=1 Tax=Antrihabitans stalactiti TaxID=2584121 RepID=A0A848KQL9_9NOCA|nr:alpha/beta hydrolase fold domain-containing protein [Antrihabitans stalactiti]NMN98892.1 alpha/beta hydrolase [Antrihabitans stalactiti]